MRPRSLSVIWPTALAAGAETKTLSCVFLKMTFKTKPISEMKGTFIVNKSEVSNLLGNKLSDIQETRRTGHRMCDCPLAETVQEIVYEFWWMGLKKSCSSHSDQVWSQEGVVVPHKWHCDLRAFKAMDWTWAKFNLKLTQWLLKPRHYCSSKSPRAKGVFLAAFVIWGNGASEMLIKMPKITRLISSQTSIQIHTCSGIFFTVIDTFIH